jgi:hypothetical protein
MGAGPSPPRGLAPGERADHEPWRRAKPLATATSHPERRSSSHISFHRPARLMVGSEQGDVEVLDVSLRGALVQTPPGLEAPEGARCTLRIRLEAGQAAIQLQGQVAHRWGGRLGVRCTSIDLESIRHLRRVVELNLGEESLLHRELASLLGMGE